jgi:hypothetical protein
LITARTGLNIGGLKCPLQNFFMNSEGITGRRVSIRPTFYVTGECLMALNSQNQTMIENLLPLMN